MRAPFLLLLLGLLPARGLAQRPDSVLALPDIRVTRTPTPLRTLAAGVTVVDSALLHRGGLTPGLADALAFVPGVFVANRWNYSLDQRLAMRGAGARANFGWRGVKVMVDGVPQTLPDGQSQLNGLDLAQVRRIEVLRGAASSEHGNASGGVLAFTTHLPGQGPALHLAASMGSGSTRRTQLRLAGQRGALGATMHWTGFHTAGFRQHAGATQRRLSGAIAWTPHSASTLTVRLEHADDPRADNPGALTRQEYANAPTAAAPNNLRRHAGKEVRQSQLAVAWQHRTSAFETDLTVWQLWRALTNPLAAPPAAPARPEEGTWVGLDREVRGVRSSATWRRAVVTVTAGLDYQWMQDDRVNRRATAGMPTAVRLVDQTETVSETGLFLRSVWTPAAHLAVTVGARWDGTRFIVDDHLGVTGRGVRHLHSPSGSAGIGWSPTAHTTLWSSLATSFETPTTTELANHPDGRTGMNTTLVPQRGLMAELGLRTRRGTVQGEATLWRSTTRDAIVPATEVGGRTFYRNAARIGSRGAEIALHWTAASRVTVRATAQVIRSRFEQDPRAGEAARDGTAIAGLPSRSAHLGAQLRPGRGLTVDLEQALRSVQFADDANQEPVAGLGLGVTTLRLGWQGTLGPTQAGAFVTVGNLGGRRHVAAVTVNGAGGRVFEPAPGRLITVGMAISR